MTIHDKPGSAKRLVLITKADADLVNPIRGLYVGDAGNVRVTTVGGDDVVIPSVPAGTIIPAEIKRVWAAGTVPTGFVGFYD